MYVLYIFYLQRYSEANCFWKISIMKYKRLLLFQGFKNIQYMFYKDPSNSKFIT